MVIKYGDGRPFIQHTDLRERKRDLLVVVQDESYTNFHRLYPSQMLAQTTIAPSLLNPK